MVTPGFNGAVRTMWVPPAPSAQGQSSAQGNGSQPVRSTGASRPTPVRSGSAMDLLRPILFILIANLLIIAGIFGVVSIVLSPLGIVAIVQGCKFGWRGIKMVFN